MSLLIAWDSLLSVVQRHKLTTLALTKYSKYFLLLILCCILVESLLFYVYILFAFHVQFRLTMQKLELSSKCSVTLCNRLYIKAGPRFYSFCAFGSFFVHTILTNNKCTFRVIICCNRPWYWIFYIVFFVLSVISIDATNNLLCCVCKRTHEGRLFGESTVAWWFYTCSSCKSKSIRVVMAVLDTKMNPCLWMYILVDAM